MARTVYLLHFSRAYRDGAGRLHRHYIGSTDDIPRRMREHGGPKGSALLRAVADRGIKWRIVRRWRASWLTEGRLKEHGHYDSFCPVCSGPRAHKRARKPGGMTKTQRRGWSDRAKRAAKRRG